MIAAVIRSSVLPEIDERYSMSTLLLDTNDLGEVEDLLGQTYGAVRINGGASDATHVRISRSSLGSLSIDDAQVGCDIGYDAEPPYKICLCRPRFGVIEEHVPGRAPNRVGADEVVAMGVLDVPFRGRVSRARCDILMVDGALFDRVAATGRGPFKMGPEPVRLTDSRPVSAAAGRRLVRTIDYLRDVVAEPVTAGATLVASTATQHLVATMLAAFPNNALLDPTVEDRRDTTPVLLRRAIAFIEDHADCDIGIADIAGAIYVTPRAIQLMFRRHRDCTPMEYLRRVRLDYAHQELLGATRAQTTVTQIAARWGFAHTGRFAVYYRQVYGESPHTTLRS
jgi:AraC-like DNA-binding protein